MAPGTGQIIGITNSAYYRSLDDGLTFSIQGTFPTNVVRIFGANISGVNRYVVVGSTNVYYGTGTVFFQSVSSIAPDGNSVAYSPTLGYWFVGSSQGFYWYSSDNGVTWTVLSSDTSGFGNETEIFWANGYLYAASYSGTNGLGYIFRITDPAATWSLVATLEEAPNAFAYTGTSLLAIGNGFLVATSSAGSTWTTQNQGLLFDIAAMAASNSRIVAVGSHGDVMYSDDCLTWTAASSTGTTNQLNSVSWSSTLNRFVAVGNSSTIIYSADGVTWTSATSPTTANWVGVNWDSSNSRFWLIASNLNNLYTSLDGIVWTFQFTIGTTTNWLAKGLASRSTNSLAILRSTTVWNSTAVTSNTWASVSNAMSPQAATGISAVTSIGYVASGSGGYVAESSTGATWNLKGVVTSQNLYAVAQGSTRPTVVVGGESTTTTSITIIYRNAAGSYEAATGYNKNNNYRAVVYFPLLDIYVAGGKFGQISISPFLAGLQTTL
jgi:hypothetical protein